jgi:hypothetical protein
MIDRSGSINPSTLQVDQLIAPYHWRVPDALRRRRR